MSFSDEYYNEDKEAVDNLGPLSSKSRRTQNISLANDRIQVIKKPEYANTVASSAIGHPTYFDQMETNQPAAAKQSKCNRIYSYFNLLDFILQLLVFSILSTEYYGNYTKCASKHKITSNANDKCTGELASCDRDRECMYEPSICGCIPSFDPYTWLFFIYMMLTALILIYMLCRSCLICFSLRNRSNNQNLFVSGRVMHQSWMNRIADDCWIALCCGCSCKSCCCNNMARIAYFASIDQYKAFPTRAAFVVNTLFKILNIAFCATQFYLRRVNMTLFVYSVMAIGALFICTFITAIYRMKIKSDTKAEKKALAMNQRQTSYK